MAIDLSLLKCISFNTKTGTPASVRETVALCEHELVQLQNSLSPVQEPAGLFYLATCHRIELYFYGYDLGEVLSCWSTLRNASFFQKALIVEKRDALQHLIYVTSSVDSEVLGETQITGQVKEAAQFAKNLGILKGPLERWIQQALRVAKRVRTETHLSRGTVSVAHVAVDGIFDFFDSLTDKSALVIGAGSMATQALERLLKVGVGKITWTNRTRSRLVEHPLSRHCQIADFEHRHGLCFEHEIIVSATSSSEAILTFPGLAEQRPASKFQSQDSRLILDLGLPRNVDEKIHGFKEFYLRNVDEFRDRVDENTKARQKAREEALVLIHEELLRAEEEILTWDRGPLIGDLKEALRSLIEEEIRHLKLEKTLDLVYITRGVQGKLLHRILKELESLENQEALEILRFLNRAWRRSDSWPQKPNLDLVHDQTQKPLPQKAEPKEAPL